jgi:hypothetical protein
MLGILITQSTSTSSILPDIDAGELLVQPYTPSAQLYED